MNEKNDEEMDMRIIKTHFDDRRKIVGKADESIQSIAENFDISADIYKTENDEFISFGMLDKDLDNKEIENIKRYGEELFRESGKMVCIYFFSTPHIKYRVTKKIESDATMLIKISPMQYSSAYDTFRHIEGLVKRRKKLDSEDLFALSMIPSMGPPEDKRYLRIECLQLWQTICKKGLIQ